MIKSKVSKTEIRLTVLFIIGCMFCFMWYHFNGRKKFDSFVVGHVVSKHNKKIKRVPHILIDFYVRGKKYQSSFAPSSSAFEVLKKGYPVMIHFEGKNPERNSVVPSMRDSSFYIDSIHTEGEIISVEKFTKLNFLVDRQSFQEVYFKYHYNGIEYKGMIYVDLETTVDVGEKYTVHLEALHPEIGVLNIDKPYEEQAID